MSISSTRKQAELLTFLTNYLEATGGVAPSFQEMTDALGLKSKSGVHRLITALVERGKILRLPDRARAIRIIPEDIFDGIPSSALAEELARRGEFAAQRRKAA